MPRKLFISFLGTTGYRESTYYGKVAVQQGKKTIEEVRTFDRTRFIQCATLQQIGATEWTDQDAIRIFVTEDARRKNWSRDITKYETVVGGKVSVIKPYSGLEAEIAGMGIKANVLAVDVANGADEEQIWQIFDTVYKQIDEGDELYIDLTYGFRYLPMFIVVLSNYAKFLKGVRVCHLSYGNWEARNEQGAPIVDLMPLTMLQDWTSVASEYFRHGYAAKLAERMEKTLKPLGRFEEKRANVGLVRSFAKTLSEYALQRLTCRGLGIEQREGTASTLNALIQQIRGTGVNPLDPIFDKIKTTVSQAEEGSVACIEAARWCYERDLYQQAVTLLREGVISLFCERNGIATDDMHYRELVSSACNIRAKSIPRIEWTMNEEDCRRVDRILSDEVLSLDTARMFVNIGNLRNDYNHAGFRPSAGTTNTLINNISSFLTDCDSLLLRSQACPPAQAQPDEAPQTAVLLNLSNHPVSGWAPEQTAAAQALGAIAEIPFPQIKPDSSTEDIGREADLMLQTILERYAGTRLTVHVMGEMTFTFALVTRLKARGIRCVASCTARIVRDLGDGRKESQFSFVGFRDY